MKTCHVVTGEESSLVHIGREAFPQETDTEEKEHVLVCSGERCPPEHGSKRQAGMCMQARKAGKGVVWGR